MSRATADVTLRGGPHDGTTYSIDGLAPGLLMPVDGSLGVPPEERINPDRPPRPVHVYQLTAEVHSRDGAVCGVYTYVGIRLPDGAMIDVII